MAHSSAGDSQVLLEPVVGERPKSVGYLCTGFVAFLHLSLSVSNFLSINYIEIMNFLKVIIGGLVSVLSMVWPRNDLRECESYFVALYLHVLYWVVSFVSFSIRVLRGFDLINWF